MGYLEELRRDLSDTVATDESSRRPARYSGRHAWDRWLSTRPPDSTDQASSDARTRNKRGGEPRRGRRRLPARVAGRFASHLRRQSRRTAVGW